MSDPLHIVQIPATATSTDTNSDTMPPLVSNGRGGFLLAGGIPGPLRTYVSKGPTPSALRAKLRDMLADHTQVMEEIATSPDATNSDKLRAVELMARFGLGEETTLTVGQVQSLSDRELDALADGVSLPDRILPDAV